MLPQQDLSLAMYKAMQARGFAAEAPICLLLGTISMRYWINLQLNNMVNIGKLNPPIQAVTEQVKPLMVG
jgi:hypothetical protein